MIKTFHIEPIKELKPYLKNVWVVDGLESINESTHKMIPYGCMDMVFIEQGNVHYLLENENEIKLDNSFFSGQITEPYFLKYSKRIKIIGFGFHPHTAHYITRLSSKQFANQIISIDDIFSRNSDLKNLIEEQLNATHTFKEKIIYLQKLIYNTIVQSELKNEKIPYVLYCIKSILSDKGVFDLQKTSNRLGISKRYIQKLFNEYIGIAPTEYAKVIKFLNSVKYLNETDESMLSICYKLGYYDQSHFIKDFKKFSGVSPKKYMNAEPQLIDNFTSNEWSSFLYNESEK